MMIALPNKNPSVSEDQSNLTLIHHITLPNDTVLVGNVMVFIYSEDDIGGRLISQPLNSSGTSQASPKGQMVQKFNLEKANVTLTSKLIKNFTTSQFQVDSIFKIGLLSSIDALPTVIHDMKYIFVITSSGKDDHQNEQQYFIFLCKVR